MVGRGHHATKEAAIGGVAAGLGGRVVTGGHHATKEGQNPRVDGWIEVRREADEELLGYVRPDPDGRWAALTVFGGVLAVAATQPDATAVVARRGLAALAERWHHRRRGTDDWQIVLVAEAWPGRARLVEGWYSLPGSDTFELTAADLVAGDELVLDAPPD